MNSVFNVYCDESCHLPNNQQSAMVLGAIICLKELSRSKNERIRKIKTKHGLNRNFEIKWTKVSPSKIEFYEELIDYFFDDQDLEFRGLIVPDKTLLHHEKFDQTHDDWYYKMYFDMLKVIFYPKSSYRIFLDIKDTRSALKTKKLHEVLCNANYDFSRNLIKNVQTVHSHEIELLQLADLMIGAISAVNRSVTASNAKKELIEQIKRRSGYKLTQSTFLREKKLNLFRWHAQSE
ncbi:DUF3800 domain-containing protein [Calditrichota bacterium]